MTYTEQTLVKDEKLTLMAKWHWLIWSHAIILLAIAIVFLAMTAMDDAFSDTSSLLAALFGICGFVKLLTTFIWVKTNEAAVTTKRVILKTGVISRSTFELNLQKVESVQVDQNILGRIFNYGSVTVLGTGRASRKINYILDPLSFRAKALAGMDEK